MADTTLTAPISFADMTAAGLDVNQLDLGALSVRFAELMNPMAMLQLVPVGGNGTRSARFGNADHVGTILASALAGEVSQPALVNRTTGYADVSVSEYGFALAETWSQEIYSKSNVASALGMQQVLEQAPMAAYRLARYLMGQTFTSIVDTVGSVSTRLSLDDIIAAQALFNSNEPVGVQGRPTLSLHPRQLVQFREAIRVEFTYQMGGQAMAAQAVDSGRMMEDFLGLGFDVAVMSEVPASGGGRYGAALDRGGAVLGVGQVQNVMPPTDGRIFLASGALGLLIIEDTNALVQRMHRLDVHLHQGAALADDAVRRQVAVISIDAA